MTIFLTGFAQLRNTDRNLLNFTESIQQSIEWNSAWWQSEFKRETRDLCKTKKKKGKVK